ncbi:hypothetical protein ACLMJK_007697 [Lecanora helva]
MGDCIDLTAHSRFLSVDQFQIMSDLHLEIGQQYSSFHIEPHAHYLVLAGDIGRLRDYDGYLYFLTIQCLNFGHVFLVLGNHEFFGISREAGLALADKLENEPIIRGNISVMNRKRVQLPGVIVLGCTLHSHIPDESKAIVAEKITDFHCIEDWTVDDHNTEHVADVKWLEREIEAIRDPKITLQRKILVLTHHAPTIKGTSAPAHEGSLWRSAFSTDLLAQPGGSALNFAQYWVFGHTHWCCEFKKGTVRLVSNQRGYVLPTATVTVKSTGQSWTMKMRKFLGRAKGVEKPFDPQKLITI